jgi:hypothetical protein
MVLLDQINVNYSIPIRAPQSSLDALIAHDAGRLGLLVAREF